MTEHKKSENNQLLNSDKHASERKRPYFKLFLQALKGENVDATTGSINRTIFFLAIPMIFEMFMESLFAVVDIFFVSKVSMQAVAVVGLTESTLTIIYSLGFGLSMGATALVARRVGEKNLNDAKVTAMQAIYLGIGLSMIISVVGLFYSRNILDFMSTDDGLVDYGVSFTRTMLSCNITIMLLFLINGIFRGAGDAGIAMRSLWIANGINIVLDPLFIFGWGPFPEMGLLGAAVATNTGRAVGVSYQIYHLLKGKSIIHLKGKIFQLRTDIIKKLVNVSAGATGQFVIASASWIFLMRIMGGFGEEVVAGYTIAIRILIFSILPAWGISNAAATLAGQNLGANLPERAEQSVWRTGKVNLVFMAIVTIIFEVFPETFVGFFTNEPVVLEQGVRCLRVICLGYIFYGYEMVMANAFNGAGDTKTPTIINFVGFWLIQIPLAYILAHTLNLQSTGVFMAVPISESLMAVAFIILFKKGKWKHVKV